jgi:hypothetical protein
MLQRPQMLKEKNSITHFLIDFILESSSLLFKNATLPNQHFVKGTQTWITNHHDSW